MTKNNFGSVRRKNSGSFQARYRDQAGRDHYKTFPTSAEAHAYLATVKADMVRGSWISPTLGKVTVDEWAETFMGSKRDIRPRTAELYRSIIRNHIVPGIGDYQLAQVTPDVVDVWLGELAKKQGFSSSSANRAFRLASQIFKHAVRYGRIPANPFAVVPAPKGQVYEALFISTAQVADLAVEIGREYPQFKTLVTVAAFTGMRWGELAGLPVRHVDPLRGTIRVSQQLHCDGRIDAPKSAHGTRTVRMPRWLGDQLAATIAERAPATELSEAHQDLVFLSPDGQSMTSASNFNRRHWRPAVRTSLPAELHRLRFHDLRHSSVPIAIEAAAKAGEPLNAKTLQARLGHGSITLTLDRYGHLLDGHDDALIAGMSNPFELRAVN